jgi:hypothetical protein
LPKARPEREPPHNLTRVTGGPPFLHLFKIFLLIPLESGSSGGRPFRLKSTSRVALAA